MLLLPVFLAQASFAYLVLLLLSSLGFVCLSWLRLLCLENQFFWLLELSYIRDTSGCLTGLINKPVFIPLVLLASHPVFPAPTAASNCLTPLPLCVFRFFNFICLHANFLYWGLFGLHLISFPEEGILRDLSSQSGTLHSYPVLGFSLKLHYRIVFCLNLDST